MRFQILCELYSGFQSQGFRNPGANFPGFRNKDSLTWGEKQGLAQSVSAAAAGEDRGTYCGKYPRDVPGIPEVFSCMRRLRSNDNLTEPETAREKSLTVRVGGRA